MRKKKASLKSLFVLIILLISLSTIVSVCLAAYFSKAMKEYNTDFYALQTESLESSLRQTLRDHLMAVRSMGLNSAIRDNIFRTDVTSSEMRQLSTELNGIINSTLYYLIDDIYLQSCVFYGYLPNDGRHFVPIEEAEGQTWYQEYQESRQSGGIYNGIFVSYEPRPNYLGKNIVYNMNLIQPINSFNSGYTASRGTGPCYQVLTVSMQGIVGENADNAGMSLHIFEEGTDGLVYSNNTAMDLTAKEAMLFAKENGLTGYNNFDGSFQRVHPETPLSVFYVEEIHAYVAAVFEPAENNLWDKFGWTAVFLVLLIFAFLILNVISFYRRFRGRIEEVVGFLDRVNVSGSPAPATGNSGLDEIQRIERHVGRMQDRITLLVKEEYELKLQKLSAQYEALTACINPHFLYNTLNTIAAMASLEEAEGTEQMVVALSDMFRYSSDIRTRYVCLKDELKNISDYLYIQGIRHRDTFRYRVDVNPGLENCRVPKLLLQPLVENCFKHGFRRTGDQSRKNEILICAVRENELLKIYVMDNGGSFSQGRMDKMNALFQGAGKPDPADGAPIGLLNVHRRLQILYGDEYGLRLSCEQGAYTCIEAKMLYREEDEDV